VEDIIEVELEIDNAADSNLICQTLEGNGNIAVLGITDIIPIQYEISSGLVIEGTGF